jgi:nucleoside-diphosphate-sugar epimerase
MRVLLTGGTGRVGRLAAPRLAAAGFAVRALVRDPARMAAAEGLEPFAGDLRDGDAVARSLRGADAVVHLAAAFRGVDPAEAEADTVNVGATLALARAALAAGGHRFVHASTNLVYGPGRGRPAIEDDEPRPNPASVYPVTKVAAERGLLALHRSEALDLRVLRLALVYGDGDTHLAEALEWARAWPGHRRVHMVHHADVAQALVRALRTEGAGGRIYNIADDCPVTAVELHLLNGETPPPALAERSLADPWQEIVDTTRARIELGFRPVHPSVYSARDAGAL